MKKYRVEGTTTVTVYKEVWDFLNDGYYDEENEDVIECYGI